jgi:hypothetical protein
MMTRFSHRLMTYTAALGLSLSFACGGDDDGDDTTDDGTTDDGTTDDGDDGDDDGDGVGACPDHPNVEAMGEVCAVTGGESDPVTEDLTLTADVEWLLNGPVWIGNDTDATVLTIEAGTTVFGGDGSFLLIQRGAQIIAEGTADAPIVFTSAQEPGARGPEDWGGLVINGRAPINNGDASGEAPGEVGTGTYGGDDPEDNSGVLRYVRVEFAGNKVDTENELNGIAFQGVGSGTEVDFIQTHMTSDDGIEFFGGTVSAKHVVITGSDDDSLDWTGGWVGSIQYLVAVQLEASGPEAENGIEADNLEGGETEEPFSDPTLSNLTLVAREGNGSRGVRFRRGTRAQLHNSIITGFGAGAKGEPCITAEDAQTLTNIEDGELVASNLVLNCEGGDFNADAAPMAEPATVVVEDPLLDPTTWLPAAESPALTIGAGPDLPFFDAVDYAGAFGADDDWAAGWIETATE